MLAMPRSGEPERDVPFEGGRLGWRAQGSRDRTSSEGDQAMDGLFARAPSTASETGTCRGEAAAGHPAGTMVLVTFAETKVTRASRAAPSDSAVAMKRGTLEQDRSNGSSDALTQRSESRHRVLTTTGA